MNEHNSRITWLKFKNSYTATYAAAIVEIAANFANHGAADGRICNDHPNALAIDMIGYCKEAYAGNNHGNKIVSIRNKRPKLPTNWFKNKTKILKQGRYR